MTGLSSSYPLVGATTLGFSPDGAPALLSGAAPAAQSSLVWALVYAGLAVFFLLGGRRFARPGYVLFGVALGLLSVAAAAIAFVFNSSSPETAFFLARLVVLAATFAPAFNTHFLHYYTGRPADGRLPIIGYVLGGAGFLADTAAALELRADERSRDLTALLSPAPLLSSFIAGVFILHLVADAAMLATSARKGRRHVVVPLVTMVVLGPAVGFSFYSLLVLGRSLMLTQMLTWVYGLAIVWGLISELLGAEGLLKQTTSSLAERTAELQVSYAELELMHDELTRKEQLAAVGELAAAIAHEVRNPLAIIMNAASGLRRPALSGDDREILLSIVDEEAERLNHLVTELLRFARPVEASRAPASLLDICHRVQSVAPPGYEVRVTTPPEENLETAWVDAGLFRLALDNVMSNAVQAMPSGGLITISVEQSRFESGDPALAVRIKDSGVGMSPAELERAKKPFFTTKPRGTGLGLPIVERIVDAHGGELSIESVLGSGTTVTIRVPFEEGRARISRSPSTRRSARSQPPASSPHGLRDRHRFTPTLEGDPNLDRESSEFNGNG